MNLVDARVIEVIGQPNLCYGKWFVEVKFNAWGVEGTTTLMFEDIKQAEAVRPGHIFQA